MASSSIYPLSLHDALPICRAHLLHRGRLRGLRRRARAHARGHAVNAAPTAPTSAADGPAGAAEDRKSTRLNSSHVAISYAVFCLKKKKKQTRHTSTPTSAK